MLTRFVAATAALVLATVVLEPVQVVAQEAPCDADPRWLLVTLIENRIRNTGTGEHLGLAVGQQILDRCRIERIIQKNPIAEPPRSTIMMRTNDDSSVWEMTATESPQDICRAVRDCGDATLPGQFSAPDR